MAFLSQSFLATMVYVMEITSKGRTYKSTNVVRSKYFQKRSAGGGKLGRQTIRMVLFLKIKEKELSIPLPAAHIWGQTAQTFRQVSVQVQVAELIWCHGQVPLSVENFTLGLNFVSNEGYLKHIHRKRNNPYWHLCPLLTRGPAPLYLPQITWLNLWSPKQLINQPGKNSIDCHCPFVTDTVPLQMEQKLLCFTSVSALIT